MKKIRKMKDDCVIFIMFFLLVAVAATDYFIEWLSKNVTLGYLTMAILFPAIIAGGVLLKLLIGNSLNGEDIIIFVISTLVVLFSSLAAAKRPAKDWHPKNFFSE